jgi:peroxisomal membrane protein 4
LLYLVRYQFLFSLGKRKCANLVGTVFARVCLSIAQLSVQPHFGLIKSHALSERISHDAWPAFAALSWGAVMWLFRWYPETVQSGLASSMDYIYVQSDTWDSLRNFLIFNK